MNNKIAPWVRVTIMLVATASLGILSFVLTGGVIPSDPKQAIVFQNALLLIVLGSAFLEHHYTKPADSVVNSLMGLVTLLSVYGQAPTWPWRVVAGYCGLVFLLSAACVAVSSGPDVSGWRRRVAELTFRPAVVLGRSRILFTIVFLSGLWFFYSVQNPMTIALVLFWGVFLVIWPLRIPEFLTSLLRSSGRRSSPIGEIVRIDSPNILRIALAGDVSWSPSGLKICTLPNGGSFWVLPLFSQFQEGRILATGLVTAIKAPLAADRNCVAEPDENAPVPSSETLNEALGGGPHSSLVGFVVEQSTVGAIRFETLNPECCRDGMLVWSLVAGQRVYYQVLTGETKEESFKSDKHGFQVATAAQLGVLAPQVGFSKHDWLPAMNAPVFTSAPDHSVDVPAIADGDFMLGMIPNSGIRVGGDFVSDYNYHTAILGVTGSGKTELAFDLIRHALDSGLKVICIDLTAQYEDRLKDLEPIHLSVSQATAEELAEKLFEAETGTYGAPLEKKALGEFTETLRDEILKSVEEFLTGDEGLGLIRLEEISNTKATLRITELYMTCLLKYAREAKTARPRVLVVVEEAHTVMPEANTMGLGDRDSQGLVGKIAQVALQGRKFGVGLLILAQRTATVSKTVLTQCNTIISFTCYDDTSLGFLKNIYGPEHVALIPNLPRLHAVASGKWIRSEQPLVFEVPFVAAKANGPNPTD